MSNIVPHPTAASPTFTAPQLALIRRTVAKDCTDDEFNLFITGYCQPLRLNPLKKQIFAIVYNKDDQAKRNMSIVISIDGYRVIAARTGNYRPGRITFVEDPEKKDPLANPEGLISATATVFVFSHGGWHEVEATAYWSEYAPIKTEGAEGFEWVETGEVWEDTGKPKKKKKPKGDLVKKLDSSGKWATMPRVMLGKVAEAQALRRAWPDDFSNVYAEEEIEHSRIDPDEMLLPSEAAEKGAVQARQERIGMGHKAILVDFMEGNMSPIVDIPVGQFADRVIEFMRANKDEPSTIEAFRIKNRRALQEFYTLAPSDAHELKARMEKAIAGEEFEG